jgi:type I restriction enzyme S subunit
VPSNAPKGIINQALMIIRFSDSLICDFLDWVLIADFFKSQILDNSQGGAMKNLVGIDIFKGIS